MIAAIEELKKAYIGECPVMDEEVIRDLIAGGFRPFRVIVSTPDGGRQVISRLAKSSAEAIILALQLLYPDDAMTMPRGINVTAKMVYTEN